MSYAREYAKSPNRDMSVVSVSETFLSMPFCGLPKDVRELVRFASDAMNAHQRGLSIPTVALHYRFEPGQAESCLRRAIQEYGPENVRPYCTRYIFSLFWPPTGDLSRNTRIT
jgi:hypothetical protein